jgi:hypothetical protein
MIEQFPFQTALTFLTLISIPVGVFYHIMTLRNQSRTRQAQLLMGLYEAYRNTESRLQSLELQNQEWTDYDDYFSKYGDVNNPEAWAKWEAKASSFNGIGVLLEKNLIDISLVDTLLSSSVNRHWNKISMGPILVEWRKRLGETVETRPRTLVPFHGFDYLYNELQKQWKKQPKHKS